MNEALKIIIVFLLTISVVVFAWFGKIPTEAFTAFVSAALMWFLNNNKIEKLTKDNEELNTKITALENENAEIIEEFDIPKK